MADDKAKLLRSLAIDRSDGEAAAPARRRRWPMLSAGSAASFRRCAAGMPIVAGLYA